MIRSILLRAAVLFALVPGYSSALLAESLPSRISDETFWKMITDFSEQEGSFGNENFVSNETLYQRILPELKKRSTPGGVYLGVGPEQNFTYIAATRPQIAFIFDIRRQNMIELLMYKALFELSADRQDFLARLFSRPLPAQPRNANLKSLLDTVRAASADAGAYDSTLRAIRQNLIETHKYKLTPMDQSLLEHVFNAFFMNGLDIKYSAVVGAPFPTYEELLSDTGADQNTENFLSTESNFQFVKGMQEDNRIIPLVGDFAGSAALRAVGDYLRDHDAEVSTFYTSNVEQYLFLDPANWKNFYRNFASFPLNPSAVVIRSLMQTGNGRYSNLPVVRSGYRMEVMLFAAHDLIVAFDNGDIPDYAKMLQFGNLTVEKGQSLIVDTAILNPNVGIAIWPDLEPPAHLTISVLSPSEIVLKWPGMKQGDITGFQISRQTEGGWSVLAHKEIKSACDTDICSFKDSNLKADTRYCYRIQSGDNYSNLGTDNRFDEDFGEPSITVCAKTSRQPN
jgi:hypothetical protein